MFLYLPVCFQQLVEPEFMSRHRLPSGEPQVLLLLVALPDLATLEHLYSEDLNRGILSWEIQRLLSYKCTLTERSAFVFLPN